MRESFSTLRQDVGHGRVFSSRTGGMTVLPPNGIGRRPAVSASVPAVQIPAPPGPTAAPQPASAPAALQFMLSGQGLPLAAMAGGPVTGNLAVDRAGGVSGTINGMPGLADPALRTVAWLIHDLVVPLDLNPADLAALPKGVQGTGNQPGGIFTMDGNPPTYGVNTVAVAITPGEFKLDGDRSWRLTGAITPATNRAFHPLVGLGPAALPDINASLPTGTVVRILTDLFLRPVTVHRDLDPRTQHPLRLVRIVQETAGQPDHYLEVSAFNRAAVTLEGPVRPTPQLMPTRHAFVAVAQSPVSH